MRILSAYLAGLALLVIGGLAAWLQMKPVAAAWQSYPCFPELAGRIVAQGLLLGAIAGGVFSRIARPRQLLHATLLCGAIGAMIATTLWLFRGSALPSLNRSAAELSWLDAMRQSHRWDVYNMLTLWLLPETATFWGTAVIGHLIGLDRFRRGKQVKSSTLIAGYGLALVCVAAGAAAIWAISGFQGPQLATGGRAGQAIFAFVSAILCGACFGLFAKPEELRHAARLCALLLVAAALLPCALALVVVYVTGILAAALAWRWYNVRQDAKCG